MGFYLQHDFYLATEDLPHLQSLQLAVIVRRHTLLYYYRNAINYNKGLLNVLAFYRKSLFESERINL